MNARLAELLEHPLAEAVGWALLHSLWQGALVGAFVALGLLVLRAPQRRYLLGCGSLLLMLALPVLWGVSHYRDLPAPLAASGGLEPASPAPISNQAAEPALPVAPTESPSVTPLSLPKTASFPATPVWERVVPTLHGGAPWLAAFWLLGVVFLLLRLLGGALYAARFGARHRTLAPEAWQTTLRALAQRLGLRNSPRLVLSNEVDTPLVLGALRPLVVLPSSALTGVPAAQLSALLAHELAHIRRHDYLVNLLQCVLETLMFYHPAVWWVSNVVRREREACCDDLAVAVCGDARLYARALVGLEALRQGKPALALAATDKPLLERVRRLLGMESNVRHAPSLLTVLLVVTLSLGVGLFLTLQPAVAQETETQASSTSLQVAEDETVVTGRVLWHGEPVAGVRLELHSRLELDDDGACCREPRVLASTTSDEDGNYTLQGSSAGAFTIWTSGPSSDYLTTGNDIQAAHGTVSENDIQLIKGLEGLEPNLAYGVGLTPTLSWQPLPEATRYEVRIAKLEEAEVDTRRYYQTSLPQFTLEMPLEADTFYQWSVEAYDEDGTQIAYNGSSFSTSPAQARVPVELTDVGVRTVLPADWQMVGAGAFEQVAEGGERRRLTFERLPGDDPEAVLSVRNESSSAVIERPYGEETWLWQHGTDRDGRRIVQATSVGGHVYLITAESTDEFPVELYAFALPLVLQNFEVIGADDSGGAGAAPTSTSRYAPGFPLQRGSSQGAAAPTPTPVTGTLMGTVRWHHTPLAGVEVSLKTPRVRLEDGSCCVGEQETLQTTTTDENGTYRFEGVAPGDYTVATDNSSLYWGGGSDLSVSANLVQQQDIQLQKFMEVISPDGEMGVPLSPTLSWKPFAGAAWYGVRVYNERTGVGVRGFSTEETQITLDAPLELNEIYQWSVDAYAQDGTRIAYFSAAYFSTAPAKEQVSVTLPELGLRVMLFEDWQRVAPDTFEWTHKSGTTYTLEFQTLPGGDAEAALLELGAKGALMREFTYAGVTWWFAMVDGVVLLATELAGQVYVVVPGSRTDGEAEFSRVTEVEVLEFTLTLVTRTLELTN